MGKKSMNSLETGPFWLDKLEKDMPDLIRKLEITALMQLTAISFGRKAPSMFGLTSGNRLKAYRRFTVELVNACSEEELIFKRRNMYRLAFRTGRCLGALPGLKELEQKKRLIILLYRNIGIELTFAKDKKREEAIRREKDRRREGTLRREEGLRKMIWPIYIPYCSFSLAYSPEICNVMSAMDAGIICGILGGGKVKFLRRITEGCSSCNAFYMK